MNVNDLDIFLIKKDLLDTILCAAMSKFTSRSQRPERRKMLTLVSQKQGFIRINILYLHGRIKLH